MLSLLDKAREVRGNIVGKSWARLREIVEVSAEPSASTVESKPGDRRAMVDAYIEEVRSKKGKRITRKDIWRQVGYNSPTEFERWQRQDAKHPNKAADQNFTRILREKPHLK